MQPESVGDYRITELVGEGSFGKVWKARRAGSLATVAVKLISKAGKTEADLADLRKEIDILRSVSHPNIIELLDAFETPSDFAVVTEFAQGELFQILEADGSLAEDVVRSVARQLVGALQYLHSHGIVHRDMKPQNVLVAADGTIKLCDFGFARSMSSATLMLTSIKGTPLYMAPELVQEKPYTHAVDLWSLGVILYELYAGKPPFYTTSIYDLVKKIVREPVAPPAGASPEFRDFLAGLLEKRPEQRLGWPQLAEHPFLKGGDAAVTKRRAAAAAANGGGAPATHGNGAMPNGQGPMAAAAAAVGASPAPASGGLTRNLRAAAVDGGDEHHKRRAAAAAAPGAEATPSSVNHLHPMRRNSGEFLAAIDGLHPMGTMQRPPSAELPPRPPAAQVAAQSGFYASSSASPVKAAALPAATPATPNRGQNGAAAAKHDATPVRVPRPLGPPPPSATRPEASPLAAGAAAVGTNGSAPIPMARSGSGGLWMAGSPMRPGHEPVFTNPPQFSPHSGGSPAPLAVSLASAALGSPGKAPPAMPAAPPLLSVLVDGERRVKRSAEAVAAAWADRGILNALEEALAPPRSNSAAARWSKAQETSQALRLADLMLKAPPLRRHADAYGAVVRALVSAGLAAAGPNPTAAAAAVEALSGAPLAGQERDAVVLFCEMISARGSWPVAAAGCAALGKAVTAAQAALLTARPQQGWPAPAEAEAVLQAALDKRAAGRLCRCVEDAGAGGLPGALAATHAALAALAAQAPCISGGVTDDGAAASGRYFPCALLGQTPELRGWAPPRTHPLLSRAWADAATAILGSLPVQHALGACLSDGAHPVLSLSVARLVHRACLLEPHVGPAAVQARLPQLLVEAAEGSSACVMPLLALSTVLNAAARVAPPQAGPGALARAAGPGGAERLLSALLPVLQALPRDVAASSTAAAALAAALTLAAPPVAPRPDAVMSPSRHPAVATLRALAAAVPDSVLPLLRRFLLSSLQSSKELWFQPLEGWPCATGLLDGPAALAAALTRAQPGRLLQAGVVCAALQLLCSLPHAPGPGSAAPGSELSAEGLLSLLSTLQAAAIAEPDAAALLARDPLAVPALLAALHPDFLSAIERSVDAGAGGPPGAGAAAAARARFLVTSLLQTPFSHASRSAEAEGTAASVQEALLSSRGAVLALVSCLAAVAAAGEGAAPEARASLPACASLLARLAVASDSAAGTFAAAGGLSAPVLAVLLAGDNPAPVLASGLLVVSQLARAATTADRQTAFQEGRLVALLPPLLRHADPAVRARAANLLGNLCRHSDLLYPDLARYDVVEPLIRLCGDPDRSTRKFACFAIGNAGFHNASLYGALRPAVAPLVALLADEEDRTRANAAGALGNLLRNSPELVPEMVAAGALEALLRVVSAPTNGSTDAVGAGSSVAIALFSLGNVAAHRPCAERLAALGVNEVLAGVEAGIGARDETVVRYAARVRTKLAGHAAAGRRGSRTPAAPPQQTPLRPIPQ